MAGAKSGGGGGGDGDGDGASGGGGDGGGGGGETTRSKRQELSFAERIQVILARKSGKSMRQLALQFGCGKTQILNILGQRESYLREWEEKEGPSNPHIGARKRRSRRTGNEETNRLVWQWYQEQKRCQVRVTGPMLQREARSIARSLSIVNFAASNGWLDSFRRLHNIGPQSKNQAGAECGSAAASAAASSEQAANAATSSPEQSSHSTEESGRRSGGGGGSGGGGSGGGRYNAVYGQRYDSSGGGGGGAGSGSGHADGIYLPHRIGAPLMEFKHFADMAAALHDSPCTQDGASSGGLSGGNAAVASTSYDSRYYTPAAAARASPLRSRTSSGSTDDSESFNMPPPQPPLRTATVLTSTMFEKRFIHDMVAPERLSSRASAASEGSRDAPPVFIRKSVLVNPRSTAVANDPLDENRRRLYASHDCTTTVVEDDRPPATSAHAAGHERAYLTEYERPSSFCFGELSAMAHSRGLTSVTYYDDLGHEWLEIRRSTASFRVPGYGYASHLVRLIISEQLFFWLEAVGQCVKSGSLRLADATAICPSLVQPVLDNLSGSHDICIGRGVVDKHNRNHPTAFLERAFASNAYLTLPDYRFRSFECSLWIDSRLGPCCDACSREPTCTAVCTVHHHQHPTGSSADHCAEHQPLDLSIRTPAPFNTIVYSAGQRLLSNQSHSSCPIVVSQLSSGGTVHNIQRSSSSSVERFQRSCLPTSRTADAQHEDYRLAKDAGRCMALRSAALEAAQLETRDAHIAQQTQQAQPIAQNAPSIDQTPQVFKQEIDDSP